MWRALRTVVTMLDNRALEGLSIAEHIDLAAALGQCGRHKLQAGGLVAREERLRVNGRGNAEGTEEGEEEGCGHDEELHFGESVVRYLCSMLLSRMKTLDGRRRGAFYRHPDGYSWDS